MDNVKKWYTFTEYYDEEGVQISKSEAERNYIKIKKNIKYDIREGKGSKTIWWECQRDKQQRLFD